MYAQRWAILPLVKLTLCTLVYVLLTWGAYAQSPDLVAKRISGNSRIARVQEALSADYNGIVADTRRLTEISTQDAWLAACADALLRSSLDMNSASQEGSVVGVRRGSGTGPVLVVAVHAPSYTQRDKVVVSMQGSRLSGPGIASNLSAAMLLGIVRALKTVGVNTTSDILFVVVAGTADERRVRIQALLESDPYRGRVTSFIALQAGPEHEITNSSPATAIYPAAATHVSRNVVQLGAEVIKRYGSEPIYKGGATDAGAAMAMGIPAIALGSGAFGEQSSVANEWIDIEPATALRPSLIATTLVLSLAGIR